LSKNYMCEYDDTGAIGKRYFRFWRNWYTILCDNRQWKL
jgi:hypothetical protein